VHLVTGDLDWFGIVSKIRELRQQWYPVIQQTTEPNGGMGGAAT
jgi:hypothetical protein